jgi:diguanylate cyclase (GGDEF)-like protein
VRSIRHGLLAIAACGFLLVIAGAAVVFGVNRTNEFAGRQEYVGDKLFGARQVYESLLGMETSQRGFLLTGDPAYLEPYSRESKDFDRVMATFEDLYSDDAEARETAGEIRRLARAKQAELTQTVELARQGHPETALDIVKGAGGKRDMEALRLQLLSLIAQERAARTGYINRSRETLRQVYLLGAGVAVLIMILVAIAVRTLAASIAHLDEAQRAEEHNAMHDALTGLPNRRYLSEWLTTALAGADRAGRELLLLYFDLDGFKAVNDRLGHEAGDRVLQVTASRLRAILRTSDFVARLGGDEFVAALPDIGEPPALTGLVERIEQCLGEAALPELADGAVTASIGRAIFPRDGNSVAMLLAAADRAMYTIKEAKRAPRLTQAPRPSTADKVDQRLTA